MFDGLDRLRLLYVVWNGLKTLPDGVFDGLANLQELNLSVNRLKTLPDGVFDGLANLEELDLGSNYLDERLTGDNGLFANFANGVEINLGGQRKPGLSGLTWERLLRGLLKAIWFVLRWTVKLTVKVIWFVIRWMLRR